MSPAEFEQREMHVLSELSQVKILADPLRVRILELLCRDELTTKQVAETLGEKPTKLYHHVDTLEKAGLVRLTRTMQNRGTLEKYYRAIARAFTVDPSLFHDGGEEAASSALPGMVASVLERTREELTELMATGGAGEIESTGLLSFCEVEASEARIEELRDRLEALIRGTAADAADDDAPDADAEGATARRFRLTLAFYPLDRSRPSDS